MRMMDTEICAAHCGSLCWKEKGFSPFARIEAPNLMNHVAPEEMRFVETKALALGR